MKQLGIMAAISASLLANAARADSAPPEPGERYEITRSYETSQRNSDGISGSSSSGRDALVERVIGVRDGGLELEYDLPQDISPEDRAREWKFPARVLRQADGSVLLLNRAELEVRLGHWLKAAQWPRSVCGRWIFTWNAFRIDCDPESVIGIIAALDLRSADLRDGSPYRDPHARSPGHLRRIADGASGARFTVVMDVEPDGVRRARAEGDVAVGEIMRNPVTLDAALRERARERVSGTIEVIFDTDARGNAWRRTRVTRLEIRRPDGESEAHVNTETVERRRISGPGALH